MLYGALYCMFIYNLKVCKEIVFHIYFVCDINETLQMLFTLTLFSTPPPAFLSLCLYILLDSFIYFNITITCYYNHVPKTSSIDSFRNNFFNITQVLEININNLD